MDLSKLPKLSESPPPPQPGASQADAQVSREAAPLRAAPVQRENTWDLGLDIGLALLLGIIFLMLGSAFGGWLIAQLQGRPYATGWVQPDGVTPVEFFDLQGGGGWLAMGEWVLGVALLLEGAILLLAMMLRRAGAKVFIVCMLLGGIGAIANVIATAMQIKMGFTMPLISIVAIFVGAFSSYMHARRVFERPARF